MTLETQTSSVTHIGNGSTTVFPFAFPVYASTDLEVRLYDRATSAMTVIPNTDYTTSGIGLNSTGGSVTYNPGGTPIPSTKMLGIYRRVPYKQEADINNQSGFYPNVIEEQLDRIVMQIQQLADDVSNAFVVPPTIDFDFNDLLNISSETQEDADAAAASASAAAASAAAAAAAPPFDLALANFDAPGSDNGRTALQVLLDWPVSVESYGAVGDGVNNDTAAINNALANNRAVFFPPYKNFKTTGTLFAQSGGKMIGLGNQKTAITRFGSWTGPTVQFGLNLAGQGAYDAEVRGLKFEQYHPGFVPGTSTSLVDRLISGQAHIALYGGTDAVIEDCDILGAQYGIELNGTAYTTIRNNKFNGSWDDQNGNLQETIAAIRIRNDATHGIATLARLENNKLQGYISVTRTITLGSITYSSHEDAGPQNGVLVEGCEGLDIDGGYIGANNRYGVFFNPNTFCTNVSVRNVFFDGARYANICFGSQGAGWTSTSIAIAGNRFVGQQVSEGAIRVLDTIGNPVLVGFTIANNTMQAYNMAAMKFEAARAGMIVGNTVGSYHSRGGGTGDATFASAAWVGLQSREIHFGPNLFGGQVNSWALSGNNCQWGAYFTDPSYGSVNGLRGLLGLAGGEISNIDQTIEASQLSYLRPMRGNGNNYIWVNGSSGKLYKKIGSKPSSDTDGTIVGTES